MQAPELQAKSKAARKKKQQLDKAKEEYKKDRAKRRRIEKKVQEQVDFLDEDAVYVGDTSHAHDPAIHIVNPQKLPLNTREKKKIIAAMPKQDDPEQLLDTLRQESKTKKKKRQKKKKSVPKEEDVVVISSSDEDERPPKRAKLMQLPTDRTLVIATDSDDDEIPPLEIATQSVFPPTTSKKEIEQPTTPKHTKFMNGEAVPFAKENLTSPPSSVTPTRLTNLAREFHRNMVGRYFIANTTTNEIRIEKPSSLTLGTKDNFSQVCCACASEDHDIFDCQRMFCTLCTRTGHRAVDCMYKRDKSCEWCGKHGHVEAKCTVKQYLITPEDVVNSTCMSCGQIGHLNCRQPLKSLKKIYCFNCGEKHIGLECGEPTFQEIIGREYATNRDREQRSDQRSRITDFFIREFLLN